MNADEHGLGGKKVSFAENNGKYLIRVFPRTIFYIETFVERFGDFPELGPWVRDQGFRKI